MRWKTKYGSCDTQLSGIGKATAIMNVASTAELLAPSVSINGAVITQALLEKNKNAKPWERVVISSNIETIIHNLPIAAHNAIIAMPMHTAKMEKALAEFH